MEFSKNLKDYMDYTMNKLSESDTKLELKEMVYVHCCAVAAIIASSTDRTLALKLSREMFEEIVGDVIKRAEKFDQQKLN